MYRTLANSKMFRRLTHRRVIINNISGYFHSSFLNIGFHKNPLQYLFLHCMQGICILFFQTFIVTAPVVQPAAVDDMHFSVHTPAGQLPGSSH